MKKIIFLIIFSLALTGCSFVKKDETKTTEEQKRAVEAPIVSDDDSLEVIEEELNDTELEDFETELDALDEEIDQL